MIPCQNECSAQKTTLLQLSILLGALVIFGVSAPAAELPSVEATTLFTLPEGAIVPNNTYTPIWHVQGKTYAVWLDRDWRPMLTSIDEATGTSTVVPLDPKPDYKARQDGHHYFSMGIDKKGYLHVTGDMHNYSFKYSATIPRYDRKHIMYWKSNKPYSLTDGFSFVGGDKDKVMPGTGWTYGGFYADNNRELYYVSRVRANLGGHKTGEMGLGLYRYDAESERWSAIGGEGEHVRGDDVEYYPVAIWENGGTPWYQAYMAGLCFDLQNRMHLACTLNANPRIPGSFVLIYGCSEDGGKTWMKADGSPIAGLPMRCAAGANQGDILIRNDRPGLTGQYFDNPNLEGEPVLERLDEKIDFKWNRASGDPGIKSPSYSVRWGGNLTVPARGPHTFKVVATGGQMRMRVDVDRKFPIWKPMPIAEKWSSSSSVAVKSNGYSYYRFVLEFQRDDKAADASISLRVVGPDQKEAVVAPEDLQPLKVQLGSFTAVCADRRGNPGVLYSIHDTRPVLIRYFDEASRRWNERDIPHGGWGRQKALLGSTGHIYFESNSLARISEFSEAKEEFRHRLGGLFCGDAYGLRTTGVYRGFAGTRGKRASVVRIRLLDK